MSQQGDKIITMMYNKQFKGGKNLKTFGGMCFVTTKKKIQIKLNDRELSA
jgi:hypothetical protein